MIASSQLFPTTHGPGIALPVPSDLLEAPMKLDFWILSVFAALMLAAGLASAADATPSGHIAHTLIKSKRIVRDQS